jgi:site-specific DNA-methyltransferase (adenine-specific)
MDGVKADMVFTDPPYNVDYSNADRPKPSKTNLGKIKNDVMGEDDFIYFLGEVYKRLDENTKTDSSFYIWYADKSTIAFYSALYETNIKFNQMIIWKKPMLLGRNRYQYAYEPCIFAVKGSPYFTEDRTKTTVWDFGGYDKSKNVHPTQKPLFLPSEALKNSSREGDAILDVFGGSGSTLIACEQLNRKCYMCELDPHYVDVIIERWENFTGKKAVLLNGE